MPRLLDLSDGFFRRLVIFNFNRQFQGSAVDPDLSSKLLLELPGIVRWAIDGLRRLRERGRFEKPISSEKACCVYKDESDPAKMFADECLSVSTDRGLQPKELYPGYSRWCRMFGFQPLNNIKFGKRMADLGYLKRRSNGNDYWLVKKSDPFSMIWDGTPLGDSDSLQQEVMQAETLLAAGPSAGVPRTSQV